MSDETVKYLLDESRIPTHWINLLGDLPGQPTAALHPATMQPIGPADLAPIFPMALIMQEVSPEPRIEIPEQVRDIYRCGAPRRLPGRRLEKALDTPAHIYYKYEGVSPAGSHKPNTAVAQAITTRRRGSSGWPPRPAPASGDRRSRLPARFSVSSARSSWSARAMTRSPTGAR